MKRMAVVLLPAALAGCLATTDLAVEGSPLGQEERAIAREIAQRTSTYCKRIQFKDEVSKETRSEMPITSDVKIRRLFYAPEGWYRAEAWSSGVIDNVYFSPTANRLVCGQKQWESYAESSRITFDEVGSNRPSVGADLRARAARQTVGAPAQATGQVDLSGRTVEQRLVELRSLFDKGLISREQYEQKRAEIIKAF